MNYTSGWHSPTRSLLQDCKHIKVCQEDAAGLWASVGLKKPFDDKYQPILDMNKQLNLDDSLPTKSGPCVMFYITQIYLHFPAFK